MTRWIVWILIVLVVAAGGFALFSWYHHRNAASAGEYRFATVERQDVESTISATGTVVPEDVVDVGAQVNGQIAEFGKDTDGHEVDYRSTVKEGQLLAKIDDALYSAQVSSDQASLDQAQAAVKVAQATKAQSQARLSQSERDWARAQKLGESQALSQADYDAAKSNYEQAVASLAVTDAQIGQAEAQVAIAQASLQRSQRNLFYCKIISPVDGVIIDRRVEIGQTVVSSLNAPSLFLIAKDLSRMQVLVQVNEADIGHVKAGEPVTFTVDAFPTQRFKGQVRKVRLNATMTQNVVTYTVEIVTENPDLVLLPYLTANVRFVVDHRDSVLTVPNAALRWEPAESSAASSAEPTTLSRPESGAASQPSERGRNRDSQQNGRPGHVWVLREDIPFSVSVRAGLTDGNVTEIMTDDLHEGDEVIIGEASGGGASNSAGTNPFAPPMFRGRGGSRSSGGGR